ARPSSASAAAPPINVAIRTGSSTKADPSPSPAKAAIPRARKNAQTMAIPPSRGISRACNLRELSTASTIRRRKANSRTARVNASEIASDTKKVMEILPAPGSVISLTDGGGQRTVTKILAQLDSWRMLVGDEDV